MRKSLTALLLVVMGCVLLPVAQAQCPGYQAPPSIVTNLACQLATTAPSQSTTPALGTTVGATMATQLTQLPIATASSAAFTLFDPSIGSYRTVSDVGPILTQRGETIGRHKLLTFFSYQYWNFDSIDGIKLSNVPVVNQTTSTLPAGGTLVSSYRSPLDINFNINQYVAGATFGLTDRIDVSVVVPFSGVHMISQRAAGDPTTGEGSLVFQTGAGPQAPVALPAKYFDGTGSGVGDVLAGFKWKVASLSERTSLAIGSYVRFPSGDPYNYLGSGAWGIKPYAVISHRTSHITPNAGVAFQWNSTSPLYTDVQGHQLNLPPSLLYTGGVDIKATNRLSFSAELLGQCVINGPRLQLRDTPAIPISVPGYDVSSVTQVVQSYAMNNASLGIKTNPWKGLFISGSVLLKLDDPGLRANYAPMVAISYRFGH